MLLRYGSQFPTPNNLKKHATTLTNMSASKALIRSAQLNRNDDHDFSFLPSLPAHETERRLQRKSNCMKRSRDEPFDMSAFLEASQQIEDSIAFPVIEWPSFDDNSDSDDDASFCYAPPSKRHCKGLVRCNRSSNLSTLTATSMSSTDIDHNSVQRQGSNGSLM